LRWSGAGLFAISAAAVALLVSVIVPLEGSSNWGNWFTATLVIVVALVALASSGAGWWLLSGHRLGVGVRLFALAEAMLLAGAALAVDQDRRWHETASDAFPSRVIPVGLVVLAALGLPFAFTGLRALRRSLAERRAADASTIDGYLTQLSVCLHTTPSLRKRILREAEDHLQASAAEVGEARAIERFGSPERLAEAFAAESRVAGAFVVAWTTLAAVSLGLIVLLAGTRSVLFRTLSDSTGLTQQTTVTWHEPVSSPRVEPVSSALTLVPPPLRGGYMPALGISALLALALALAATALARRRPRVAVACSLLAMVEGAMALVFALVLWRRLAREYVPLPPHAGWICLTVGVVMLAAFWCALELAPRRRPQGAFALALCAFVALPVVAGAAWRAPQPPCVAHLGLPPSPWLMTSLESIGSGVANSPLAVSAENGRIAFAWVGWSYSTGGSVKRLGAQKRARISGYSLAINGDIKLDRDVALRPSLIAVSVPDPAAVRALAVAPATHSAVAWGTANELWLKLGKSPAKQIADGHVRALRLVTALGRQTLLGIVDDRLVLARAPLWRLRPLARVTGDLLSVQVTGSALAVLTSYEDGLSFALRAADGRVLHSWPIPLRGGRGVVGRLDSGQPVLAYSGSAAGHYSLGLATVRGARLQRRTVASDRPCAVPIAVGSVQGTAAVLAGSRCALPGGAITPDDDIYTTFEFVLKAGRWQPYEFPGWPFSNGAYLDGAPYPIVSSGAGRDITIAAGSRLRLP
jgi:hypothetical protein